MKKTMYCILAIAFFAMACEKVEEHHDNIKVDEKIVIEDITRGDIEDLLLKCNDAIVGKEVFEKLTKNGVVLNKSFWFYDDEWRDKTAPGAPAIEGFVLEDNICNIYGYTAVNDGSTPQEFFCRKYECYFDETDAKFLTKSKCHDFTYSAKVLYFKDNTIIIDGVLGMDDYLNDDYADRRYIYLCTLDNEVPAKWKERLDE